MMFVEGSPQVTFEVLISRVGNIYRPVFYMFIAIKKTGKPKFSFLLISVKAYK